MRCVINSLLILFCFYAHSGITQEMADEEVFRAISTELKQVFGDVEVSSVQASQIPGMFEVMLGAEVIYASADGHYVFQGDLIDIKNLRNLSEERRSDARVNLFQGIPAEEIIEFAPEDPDHMLYVFTDITCGYCQQLHREMADYNANGIGIRYLAFPRSGLNSPDYVDMQSVWCADDKAQAMSNAKIRRDVSPASCSNPVAKHFSLGQEIGITGTPAVFLEDGRQIGGYVPADRVLEYLNEQ